MATRDNNRMNSQDPRVKSDPENQASASQQQSDEAKPGKGINQAGFIKDKDQDAGSSNSPGTSRDPGQSAGGKGR
jgi:hypothetical protein